MCVLGTSTQRRRTLSWKIQMYTIPEQMDYMKTVFMKAAISEIINLVAQKSKLGD